MHDTHTRQPSLESPQYTANFYTARKRPDSAQALFSRWLLAILVCLSMQLSAGIRATHAESPQPGSGVLMLHHTHGESEAVQLDAHIDLSVQGLLAEVSLKQTFQNSTNQWLEASYLFPLPEKSAIRGLTLQIGDRTIRGTVQTRSTAKQTYTDARDAGHVAGLIEQHRPNLFKMKVASIAPGDLIEVQLDVMFPIQQHNNVFAVTLPTTLTPRYSSSIASDRTAVQSPFNEPSRIRGPRLSMKARIAPIENYSAISSTTHILDVKQDSISLTDVPMDRDIKLTWPAPAATTTQGHAFVSSHKGQRYVQLLINPPTIVNEHKRPARELILVIDKSGSMAGVSMDAAKQALHYAIDELNDDDYVNIVAFDDQRYPMSALSLIANQHNRKRARNFIDQLNADGGTEMQSALSFALTPSAQSNHIRQVVFLTDGSIAYEDALLAQIKQRLGKSRLFTIGIGPAPNTWFLEKAAQAGRGIALSIQDTGDVAEPITELLTNLAHPVITDLAVQYPVGSGELYPEPIPDLYANKPNMLVSRISDSVNEIVITGNQQGERWRQTISLPPAQTAPMDTHSDDENALAQQGDKVALDSQTIAPALAMHWARQKIASLMDEQRFAIDADLHKPTITQLALDVGLVSRYTSFVAVETTPAVSPTPQQVSANVTNLIPAGNQMMSIVMPQGATGADSLAVISLLLGLAGVGFCLAGRSRA